MNTKELDHDYLIHVDAERIAKEAGLSLSEYKGLHPSTKLELSRLFTPSK